MVNPGANRHGRGLLGCLFPIVLLVGFIYVGIQFGRPWFAYRQFQDEMRSVAKMSETLTDSAMTHRIQSRADSLGLPPEAKRLSIRRLPDPARLEIRSQYEQTVKLPLLGPKVITFKPNAVEPI
jgi:hypothetical protein